MLCVLGTCQGISAYWTLLKPQLILPFWEERGSQLDKFNEILLTVKNYFSSVRILRTKFWDCFKLRKTFCRVFGIVDMHYKSSFETSSWVHFLIFFHTKQSIACALMRNRLVDNGLRWSCSFHCQQHKIIIGNYLDFSVIIEKFWNTVGDWYDWQEQWS